MSDIFIELTVDEDKLDKIADKARALGKYKFSFEMELTNHEDELIGYVVIEYLITKL